MSKHTIIIRDLTPSEMQCISEKVESWSTTFLGQNDRALAGAARILAEDLPIPLRSDVLTFANQETSEALLLRKVFQPKRHETPADLSTQRMVKDVEEIILGVMMSLCGQLFAYANQQSGRIFNDVIPLDRLAEVGNSSSGSMIDFDLHTEDAYHPFPPDFVGLFCCKNDERAETVIAPVPNDIPDEYWDLLSSCSYQMSPNKGSSGPDIISTRYVPVLYGTRDNPYIQLNIAALVEADHHHKIALDGLVSLIRDKAIRVVLEPGDILIINNLRALHGRGAFQPHDGGSRRWLIRTLVRLDVRRVTASTMTEKLTML